VSRTFPIELPPESIALGELPVERQDEARDVLDQGEVYYYDSRPVVSADDDGNKDPLPKIQSWNEFVAEDITEPTALVDGVLDVGAKMVLGGGSKSFKTWVMLMLALAVALGVEWMGFPCTKGRVLYINLEIRPFYLRKRLRCILVARGLPGPEFLDVWNLRGHAMGIDKLRPIIETRLQSGYYSMVIIDPAYKILGDRVENSNEDMAHILNEIERLAVNTGAAVVIAAHFSKGDQSGKSHLDRVSGAGTWARDPDVFVTLTPHKSEGCFSVETTLRDHPPVDPFVVEWAYPLMSRRAELDPADLKKAKGREARYSREQMLDALKGQMTTTEWQKAAIEMTGCSESTFNNYKKCKLVKDVDYIVARGLNRRCCT
jgi:hypothetical protein